MITLLKAPLEKMHVKLLNDSLAHYYLASSDSLASPDSLSHDHAPLNDYLGKKMRLSFLDAISCVNCQRALKKPSRGGYCYPCSIKKAEADICMVRPELCHYSKGTCRDDVFAKAQCFKPHAIYLSFTGDFKVGITREHQIPTRFIDQGALGAFVFLWAHDRKTSGEIEVILSEKFSDKTSYLKLFNEEIHQQGMALTQADFEKKLSIYKNWIEENIKADYGEMLFETRPCAYHSIRYPLISFPKKAKSVDLFKEKVCEGVLLGIKGQYLILDERIINIRSHEGLHVQVEVDDIR